MIDEMLPPATKPVDILFLSNPINPEEPDVVLVFYRDCGEATGYRFSYHAAKGLTSALFRLFVEFETPRRRWPQKFIRFQRLAFWRRGRL